MLYVLEMDIYGLTQITYYSLSWYFSKVMIGLIPPTKDASHFVTPPFHHNP